MRLMGEVPLYRSERRKLVLPNSTFRPGAWGPRGVGVLLWARHP